jgi:hypothetical protein
VFEWLGLVSSFACLVFVFVFVFFFVWLFCLFGCLVGCWFGLVLVLVFQDRVSLYNPGCPGTHSVHQTGLEFRKSQGIKSVYHHPPDLCGTFCRYNPQSIVTLTLHDVPLSTSTQGDHVEGQERVSEWERDEEIRPRPLQTCKSNLGSCQDPHGCYRVGPLKRQESLVISSGQRLVTSSE